MTAMSKNIYSSYEQIWGVRYATGWAFDWLGAFDTN